MSETGLIRQAVEAYFDRRGLKPQRAWDSWLPAEHAHAFTVARSAGFDILGDIRAAVRKAVLEGVSFDQFRAELTPKLQAAGWWGQRKRVDTRTGGVVTEQLGSPRRLKTIYEANIRSAQAAGEWADAWANREVTPYLEYMTSVSERKRPQHLAWVGTTLPIDHPWWRTHYPPNGWNCKCRARPRSDDRRATPAQRRAPRLELQAWRSRATGESRLIPKGIDPGWDSNPGQTRQRLAGQALTQRLDRMVDADARREAVARLRRDPAFRYIVDNDAGYSPATPGDASIRHLRWPVAVLTDAAAASLGSESRVVTMTAATAEKQLRSRNPNTLGVADYEKVQQIIDAPDAVEIDGGVLIWRVIDGKPWKIVLKLTDKGEVFITSFRRDSVDQVGKV